MTTTLLVIVLAGLEIPQLVLLLLLMPAVRDHHRHTPKHKAGAMTDTTERTDPEPLGDHTLGFLIRRWIRGRYRYLRVRDERDAADRAGDYE